jgi:hypothetical protein
MCRTSCTALALGPVETDSLGQRSDANPGAVGTRVVLDASAGGRVDRLLTSGHAQCRLTVWKGH